MTVEGARIAYRNLNPAAKGTPLVLIIGYGSTMTEWDLCIQRLAEHRRVIVFDNRGIGNLTGSLRGLTILRMADDSAGLIRALAASDRRTWMVMGRSLANSLR